MLLLVILKNVWHNSDDFKSSFKRITDEEIVRKQNIYMGRTFLRAFDLFVFGTVELPHVEDFVNIAIIALVDCSFERQACELITQLNCNQRLSRFY